MKDQDRAYLKSAQEIRNVCLDAVKDGFREASMSGLCIEGPIKEDVGSTQ